MVVLFHQLFEIRVFTWQRSKLSSRGEYALCQDVRFPVMAKRFVACKMEAGKSAPDKKTLLGKA